MLRSPLARGLALTVALGLGALQTAAGLHVGTASAAPVAAAGDAAPFTLAVIPDTQGYTVSDALAPTIKAQTQWVVDKRSELNIAFTTQLGDLVESWPNVNHWRRVSTAFETLDQNAVPYSVLPGNHDIDFATGDAPTYNQYFPPARFRDAAWNNAATRYGGYLGSNTFGADPVDRGNMNNFNLFGAGGVDWLLLNLEYESPDYALAWAQKVIDAYPDRRVIMATHGFIETRGWRTNEIRRSDPGVRSSNAVWNEFVYKNCAIHFVLNGHYHDGDLGEARRTDPNACGEPVHQLLSDYQERVNGGDGWLRYYTFHPDLDKVDAYTYSVTRQEFESDSDSRFTLTYDMTPSPDVSHQAVLRGGSQWRHSSRIGAWEAGWEAADFNDSTWSSGAAPLGFGGGMVATTAAPGDPAQRAPSLRFRRTFDVAELAKVSRLRLITKADDGLVVRVNGTEIGRASVPSGPVDANTYATAAPRSMAAGQLEYDVPLSLLKASNNIVAASLHLNSRSTADVHFDLVAVATRTVGEPPPPPAEPVALVPQSAEWRWRFSADSWPGGWTTPTYEDAAWARGPAVLGYGTTVATNVDVPAGTTRPRSALFRHTFTIDDPARYSDLRLLSRADDGVLITVNGVEVNRTRVPNGTLSNASYATAAPSTAAAAASPVDIAVPASVLRSGTNVIAAATLLNYRTTPNISFTAGLTGLRSVAGPTAPGQPSLTVTGRTSTSASLSWTPGAGDPATSWTLKRDGETIATPAGGTRTYDDTGLTPGRSYTYSLSGTNSQGTSPAATVSVTLPAAPVLTPVTLVQGNSSWRYRFSTDWPTGWSQASFDDSTWGAGNAVLGFGNASVATTVDVPPPTSNRPRSMLFRRTLQVASPSTLSDLVLTTRADDGIVVLVNGVELGRANVAAGPISASSYATAAPRTTAAANAPVRWNVPASMLRDGSNVITAAVLLNYRATPDATFDLTLAGQRAG